MAIGKRDQMIIVKPEQTKNVIRKLGNGKNIHGIPHDNGWIFKINDGPIYTYSRYAEESEKYNDILVIQKDNGPIVIITPQNLMSMIEPGSKALKYVEKGELMQAIHIYNLEKRKKLRPLADH